VIVDVLLSSLVQCVQELVKLILGLVIEHRQQLLVLSARHHLRVDGIPLFSAKNFTLVKFTDKSGMFGIKTIHQEHVMLTDCLRVKKCVIKL